jgi:hypothetical protein
MTRSVVPREDFPRWHYKNDLTHIRFYSPETFRWLAAKWGADLQFPAEDVALFRRNEDQ